MQMSLLNMLLTVIGVLAGLSAVFGAIYAALIYHKNPLKVLIAALLIILIVTYICVKLVDYEWDGRSFVKIAGPAIITGFLMRSLSTQDIAKHALY